MKKLKEELKKKLYSLLTECGYEKGKIKNGLAHVHMLSLKDTGSLPKDMIKRAKELHCPVIGITDHGYMVAIFESLELGQENGIKIVAGCECYLEEPITKKKLHLCLYGNGEKGFKALSKIVTKSNLNIETVGTLTYPIVSMELLQEYAKEGALKATSACINGPICNVFQKNEILQEQINKIMAKAGSKPNVKNLEKDTQKRDEAEQEIKELRAKKRELSAKEKRKSTTNEEIIAMKSEINKIDDKIVKIMEENKKRKERIKTAEESLKKYESIIEKAELLKKEIISEDDLFIEAIELALYYEELFGKGNFFLEVQNHGMEAEAKYMPKLAEIAKITKIPLVAANDVHISTQEEVMVRQIIRSTRFQDKWEEIQEADYELYIKDDFELAEALAQILPVEQVLEAMNNVSLLLESCEISFPKENHYPKFKTKDNETSKEAFIRLLHEGIAWRFPNGGFDEVYQKRLQYELNVINKMGFADYFLIVQDMLDFGRKLGHLSEEKIQYLNKNIHELTYEQLVDYVEANQTEIGFSISPGRGSAAGSLVCYLFGITSIDPVKYDLLFERFLNEERVTMPDIDSDIAKTVRPLLIIYLQKKYGKNALCCILALGYEKARGSIRTAARVKGSKDKQDQKAYNGLADEIAKKIPEDIESLYDYKDELYREYANNTDALEIIDWALFIQGQPKNYTMHAAGVIISDNNDVSDYFPLMLDETNNVWKSQVDKEMVEKVGCLKMDLLGLRNLDVITNTTRLIKKRYGISLDVENLPFEPEVFRNIFCKGETIAVFQLESNGMRSIQKQFKPDNFLDIILLIAVYRPGPMQYIQKIIQVKQGKAKPDYIIPEMKEVLDSTYGYPIYQEQIMEIFHRFANFTLGEADTVRRYMSKKKEAEFLKFKPKFIEGMVSNGAEREKAESFWNEIVEFSKYAFNKSHAAAYALVCYITAYLKYYYPAEYICSVLNSYDTKPLMAKIQSLTDYLDKRGIRLLPPDVNLSEYGFQVTPEGNIRYGLSNIKGIGSMCKNTIENRPYTSFRDFVKRGSISKTELLLKAGALDSFNENREALLYSYAECSKLLEKILKKEEACAENEEKISIIQSSKNPLLDLKAAGYNLKTVPKISILQKRIEIIKKEKEELDMEYNRILVPTDVKEIKRERLDSEKALLGLYVSESPLNEYKQPQEIGCVPINEAYPSKNAKIMGIITDLQIKKRKKDGAEMAFFQLEDKTGKIAVNCFPQAYAPYKELLCEGNIILLEGNITEKDNFEKGNEEEDEKLLEFSVNKVAELSPYKPYIVLHVNSLIDWTNITRHIVNTYVDNTNGYPLILDDKLENKLRRTSLMVSETICKDTYLSANFLK